MRHQLRIQLKTAEGAVLRALGLVERRGFRLEAVHAAEAQGDGQTLTITVSGDRPADLLRRQLERLHDVLWVEEPVVEPETDRTSAPWTNPGAPNTNLAAGPRRGTRRS